MENHEKDTKSTQNSENSDTKDTETVATEPWTGVLQVDPLTVQRIREANQIVEDLEEAGEL